MQTDPAIEWNKKF